MSIFQNVFTSPRSDQLEIKISNSFFTSRLLAAIVAREQRQMPRTLTTAHHQHAQNTEMCSQGTSFTKS